MYQGCNTKAHVPASAWDARCRQAHTEGRVVVVHQATATGPWIWRTMPIPPPGDDLLTWPEAQP